MLNDSSATVSPPAQSSAPGQKPLRVALMLDTRVWAGTEAHVLALARALKSLAATKGGDGVKVTIATMHDSVLWERARKDKLPTLSIARRGEWDPATALAVARRLRRGEIDVVHVHNGRTAFWGVLAVKLAGRGACVATQHFIAPARASATGLKGKLQNAVHRLLEGGIAHHIAISHAVAEALLARSDVAPESVSVVHNGIEVPDSPASTDDLPDELRAEIACIARLELEKDIPTLIHAVKVLNARRGPTKQVRCVIAGEGEQDAALKALVQKEDVGDCVFLVGWITQAAGVLSASQVSVLPSIAEPFGLAVLEAMAQHKPVIAVNVGGPPEIVCEGETGLLIPPRDPNAMADALEILLDDPNRAAAMGEAGYERLRSCFSAQSMACQTLAVYQAALEKSRKH